MTLEAEGLVGAVDVVVNGLGQGDDVHARVLEELGALLGAVAPQDHQAVQVEAVVGVQHGGHHVVAVLVHDGLAGDEGLTAGAQDGAAGADDAGEVLGAHELVVVLDEPPVAVVHAEDLDVVHILEEGLAHAPDGGVEPLTVPAAGEQAHSGLAFHMAVLLVKRDFKFTVASPIIAEPRQNCNPGLEALSIKNPPPPGG